MDTLEVVVTPPGFWGDEEVERLAAALEEVVGRFPGAAVDIRLSSPALAAQVDQLTAALRETRRDHDEIRARLARAEATARRLEAAGSPVRAFVTGFAAGVGAVLVASGLASLVGF